MEITVERFGRVVIPKKLRDYLGLGPGVVLEIEQREEEGLVLRPRRREPDLVKEHGVLVFTGEPTADLETTVEQQRQDRLVDVAAWG